MKSTFALALGLVALAASPAAAQLVTVYSPLSTYGSGGVVVSNYVYGAAYNPPQGYYATVPRVAYYTPAATFVRPTEYCAPVTTYYAPTVVPTTTYYAPVTTYYAAPAYATYYAPATVIAGRQVIVRPKVYVRGQPVRNVVRAVTP